MTDIHNVVLDYSMKLDDAEREIRERIAKLTGFSSLVKSVAFASKDSLERIFDWKGKGAKEFQKEREQYMDLVFDSYTLVSQQKMLLSQYSRLPEGLPAKAIESFLASGDADFLPWAKNSQDANIRRFAAIVEQLAKNSDALGANKTNLAQIEKKLNIETAISIAMVVGTVLPTGALASKGVGKLAELGASKVGGILAKKGVEKGITFAGGFLLDNLIGDTVGITLSGANAKDTFKELLPGYVLGLGMIGGTKALASQLTREHLKFVLDYITKTTAKIAEKASRPASKLMKTVPSKKLVEYARSLLPLASFSEIQDFLIKSFKEHVRSLGTLARLAEVAVAVDYTIIIMDKSKTWLLNSLTPDIPKFIGDGGLEVYFSAIKKLEEKYKASNIAYRTTKEGDEACFVLAGKEGRKIAEGMPAELAALMKEEAIKRGFKPETHPGIFEAITAISCHKTEFTVRAEKGGAAIFDSAGRKVQLDDLIAEAEVAPLFARISGKARKLLGPLLNLKVTDLPPKIPDNFIADCHLMIRANLDGATSSALMEVAQTAGKGVSQVGLGMAGPSLLNLLGHRVTDAVTSLYYSFMKETLEKRGVEAYMSGPMSLAFRLKEGVEGNLSDIVSAVAAEADRKFAEKAGKLDLGLPGVVSAIASKRFQAEQQLVSRALGFEISQERLELINLGIALLHVDKLPLSKVSKGLDFGKKLELGKLTLPEWARNAVDAAYFLKINGFAEKDIPKVLDNLAAFGNSNRSKVSNMLREAISSMIERGRELSVGG